MHEPTTDTYHTAAPGPIPGASVGVHSSKCTAGAMAFTVTSDLSQPVDLSENTHIFFKRLT